MRREKKKYAHCDSLKARKFLEESSRKKLNMFNFRRQVERPNNKYVTVEHNGNKLPVASTCCFRPSACVHSP